MKESKLVIRTYVSTWSNVMKKVREINRMAMKHKLKESSVIIEDDVQYVPNGRRKTIKGAKLTWAYIV
jgi:hypothetical protein